MVTALAAALLLTQTDSWVPSQTTVAILPSANISGDKYLDMVRDQKIEADGTLQRLFAERGFKVASAESVAAAIATAKVDLSDEENYRKESFYAIGEAAHADIVVFTAITQTWQKTTQDILFSKLEGFASMKTWVLDVKNHKPILSAAVKEGRSTKNSPTGSARQIRAVRLGLEAQLKPFLSPFKKVEG